MVNKEKENQSNTEIDLKEGNEGNFGSSTFLNCIDQSCKDLALSLGLSTAVNSVVYKNLFTKEIVLDNHQADNFCQVVVKYSSAHSDGSRLTATRANHTMLNLNRELAKLNKTLLTTSAAKIEEFVRKLVFFKAEEITFDIEVEVDEFYLSLIIYSAKDLHSVRVEIF